MQQQFPSHRPTIMSTKWMITADHPLAAEAGAAVLHKGGNAVDAAVAANLVMAVVRPHMCGLGGDLFALVYMAESGELAALDASGRSPAQASLDFYRERGYGQIPETGIFTATVPGAMAGWEMALAKYGTMKLADLMPPAIHYAVNGFPAYGELIEAILLMQKELAESPAAAQIFLPGGAPPALGSLVRQPALAQSLGIFARHGAASFYKGPLGESLVAHSRGLGGLFEMDDLARHTGQWRKPVASDYKGCTILSQPPVSQGIALLMQANILANFDLAAMGHNSPDCVHAMVEAKKLAFADRDQYVCDPDFYPVPVEAMLSQEGARAQAARIDPDRAAEAPAPRNFTGGGEDTVFLSVVDGDGNAVSLIQSLFMHFGSCVMDPATGIILHNRGRGFSLDPGHVNRLEPNKRPYHTLHPAMVMKDGLPFMVLGTPGADGQTQTVMQLLVNFLEFGATPQQAVEAPRWRSNPDGALLMENSFPAQTVKALQEKGHRVELVSSLDQVMGSAQMIHLDRKNNILAAGACPRRQAYAIGF